MHRFKYPFKKEEYLRGACRYEAYTTDYHSSNTVLWSKEMFFKRSFKKTSFQTILKCFYLYIFITILYVRILRLIHFYP